MYHVTSNTLAKPHGCKQTATAVALIRNGRGAIKINSVPIKLIRPEILRYKLYETVLVVGEEHFRDLNIRCRASGGGQTAQIYAIRQAIAKAVVAYYAKYKDAASAFELKKLYTEYDRSLLIADPRRTEPKKFGGRGARARRQKSWVFGLHYQPASLLKFVFKQLPIKACGEFGQCFFVYSLLVGFGGISFPSDAMLSIYLHLAAFLLQFMCACALYAATKAGRSIDVARVLPICEGAGRTSDHCGFREEGAVHFSGGGPTSHLVQSSTTVYVCRGCFQDLLRRY